MKFGHYPIVHTDLSGNAPISHDPYELRHARLALKLGPVLEYGTNVYDLDAFKDADMSQRIVLSSISRLLVYRKDGTIGYSHDKAVGAIEFAGRFEDTDMEEKSAAGVLFASDNHVGWVNIHPRF